MPILLLFILYFIYVSFVFNGSVSTANIGNPFLSFYGLQLQFIQGKPSLLILLFIIFIFVFIRFDRLRKHIVNRFLDFFKRVLVLSLTSSLLSFFILFLIGVIHLNSVSLLSFVSKQFVSIESDPDVIYEKLIASKSPPEIILEGEVGNKAVRSATVFQSGKNNFYGYHVIPYVPNYLIIPMKKIPSDIILAGDVLIVRDINSSGFQKVSPVVANLLINNFLPGRVKKPYPKLTLVDKGGYLEFRKENIVDKLETIDNLIARIDQNIQDLTISVQEEVDEIGLLEENLRQEKFQREREFTRCVNEGYYDSGVFIRVNTRDNCQEQFASQDEAIKQITEEIEDLKLSVSQKRQNLNNNREFLDFYDSQKRLSQSETDYITFEYAVFNPPDIIKMNHTLQNNDQALADYFAVLIHEYLHYETYDETNGLNSLFFTEGLTEYFAREIVKKGLGRETNLAYPVNVRIISQIMKRISVSDMAEIYFSGNSEGLERIIDLVYEKGFFRNNLITLERLHYSLDSQQILNLANEIMTGIGGGLLTKDDIRSESYTFSN